MSNKKFKIDLKGKGYYIALILCAAAIGISGYMYYRNAHQQQEKTLENPAVQDSAAVGADVQTALTEPDATTIPQTTQPSAAPGKITKPVNGETVLGYAMEALCYNPTTRDWRTHNGIDIAAQPGAQVCAAAEGTVYTVYEDETMGTTVVIRHGGGYVTKYASLAPEVSVAAGQSVSCGEVIGKVGCSALLETAIGDHLHFSVSCNGEAVDPNEFLAME